MMSSLQTAVLSWLNTHPFDGQLCRIDQVDDDPAFGSPEIDGMTTSAIVKPVSDLAPGSYHW